MLVASFQVLRMATEKMIYTGWAVHNGTEDKVHISVYYRGGRNYRFTRSDRVSHHWTSPSSIDPEMLGREFTRAYNLRDVELEPVLPTRTEGQR